MAPAAQPDVDERNAVRPSPLQSDADPVAESNVRSASALVGATVHDAGGAAVGEATDVMIDVASGRVAYVVVSVGAVLGIGGERYAVPWSAIRLDAGDGTLRLAVAIEVLTTAPVVEAEFWPEMTADERWSRAVHEHFGATPYWQR